MELNNSKVKVRTFLLAILCCGLGASTALAETMATDPATTEKSGRAAMTTEDWQANDQFQAPAVGVMPDVKPLSPLDQSNDPDKLQLTARIRQAIVASPMFSQAAKNINIITTADGKVTLKGRVESEGEMRNVLDAAKQAAPDAVIANELRLQQP